MVKRVTKPTMHNLVMLALAFIATVSIASADDFPPVIDSPSEAHLKPMNAAEALKTLSCPLALKQHCSRPNPTFRTPSEWPSILEADLGLRRTTPTRIARNVFDLTMRDRVLIFEDADGDGRAEKRTVFTDQVQMLTSVELGLGGAWLMCPPNLLFIPDEKLMELPMVPPRSCSTAFKSRRTTITTLPTASSLARMAGCMAGAVILAQDRWEHLVHQQINAYQSMEEFGVIIQSGSWSKYSAKVRSIHGATIGSPRRVVLCEHGDRSSLALDAWRSLQRVIW